MKIQSHRRRSSLPAFTLIEMLVVIAIIGILAALIVVAAPAASRKMKFARMEGEREALVSIIEKYKARKNFYPPDNTNDSVVNPLFYELGGTKQQNDGSFLSTSQETLTPATVGTLFGMGGFINSSADQNEVENFLKASLKQSQFATVSNGGPTPFTILGVPIKGPLMLKSSDNTREINPWRYVSSHATNNEGSFDLWMDITIGGTTYRISNWSKEPQVL
jgi:prepilin-type N-terminal cleavage/methylation domain-containing protein